MQILVLGGTGAMGTPLVTFLSEKGNEVYVTSREKHASDIESIHYITGNAQDYAFISKILKEKNWDVIIDFMYYYLETFLSRIELFLGSTKQYIFLSSSRVYADSEDPITELSPRLLDVCKDTNYINSSEYAIVKAKEENILFESKRTNWTIIRPYITYNSHRMQLGVYEKEQWLYRILSDKKIIFPDDIGEKVTAFTYGEDVARIISMLVGNKSAYGKVYHVVNAEELTWNEILEIYSKLIKKYTGKTVQVIRMPNSDKLKTIWNADQITYDRLYNRRFNNSNLQLLLGGGTLHISFRRIGKMFDRIHKCTLLVFS